MYKIIERIKIFFKQFSFSWTFFFVVVGIHIALILITPTFVEAAALTEIEPQFTNNERYKTFFMSDFQYNEEEANYYSEVYVWLGSTDAASGTDYYWSNIIKIPANLYNNEKWVLHLLYNGLNCFPEIVVLPNAANALRVRQRTPHSTYTNTVVITQDTVNSTLGIKRYTANDWTNWSLTKEYTTNESWYQDRRHWSPNGILYKKNCTVQYYNSALSSPYFCDYSIMTIRPNIELPTLTNSGTDFKMDLGYYYNNTTTNGQDTFSKTLNNINVILKDLNSVNEYTNNLYLTKTIYEEEENYFIDFSLEDLYHNLYDRFFYAYT